jgi:hypothetical protein
MNPTFATMTRVALLSFLLLATTTAQAQRDSAFTFSAYAEVYYSFDLSQPSTNLRPRFLYNHKRHNEVDLNLGFLKAAYAKDGVRGSLALMAGSYARYNLANEDPALRSIFEANAGVRIHPRRNLWVDAGILPSHIGFESAIGKDCWTLTRSMLADNTPYYEAGVRLSHTSADSTLYAALLVLNGWQRISRPPGETSPAFGTQLTYKPNTRTTLNWSTFIGRSGADSLQVVRLFNNLYAQLLLSDRIGLVLGCDLGVEDDAINTRTSIWATPVLIARYRSGERSFIALRIEHFHDPEERVVTSASNKGFRTAGFSMNYDRAINDRVLWRIEARSFNSLDPEFLTSNEKPARENYSITTSLAFAFN